MDNNNSGCLGGLPTMLLVVFIVLKLTHVIDWSWWWVLSPVWISILLVGVGIVIILALHKWIHG